MYRLTGDEKIVDVAGQTFDAIDKQTRTEIASAAIEDVTIGMSKQINRMGSFWLAETLKYFYLIFSDPEVSNLNKFIGSFLLY